jgi:hypothetical protein
VEYCAVGYDAVVKLPAISGKGRLMSENSPVFFFSYARELKDPLLEDFFEKLKWQASHLGIGDIKTVGFRDTDNLNSGDDWTKEISKAVGTSKVLICIYTPQLFKSPYCGKEFAAFLERSKARYEPVREADGKTKYSVCNWSNIIPILWTAEDDLKRHPDKLPPHLVSAIQYTIGKTLLLPDKIRDSYQTLGLRMTYNKSSKATRDSFALHFAREIRDAPPLPSPDRPLIFEDLWDAFCEIPKKYAPKDAAFETDVTDLPSAVAEPVSPGMGDMVAIEVRSASDGPAGWMPTLAAVVKEIAYEHHLGLSHVVLDPHSEHFEAGAWSIIEEATRKLAMPILFVDPKCLKVERHRSALVRLIQRKWRGGIVLPADESDMGTVRAFKDGLPDLKGSHAKGAHIVVRDSSTGIDKLRTSVDSVRLDLFNKIADAGEVQQKPPQNEGPDACPRISNHLDSSSSNASGQRRPS